MALTFGVRASEWFARRPAAERLLGRPHIEPSLCGSCPIAGRAAFGGAEAALSVMDYRRLLMSRVVPGQFDDADSSDSENIDLKTIKVEDGVLFEDLQNNEKMGEGKSTAFQLQFSQNVYSSRQSLTEI